MNIASVIRTQVSEDRACFQSRLIFLSIACANVLSRNRNSKDRFIAYALLSNDVFVKFMAIIYRDNYNSSTVISTCRRVDWIAINVANYLLEVENEIMKAELEKLIAMPAIPDASRKSPKIMANDDDGPNVVNCKNSRFNTRAYIKSLILYICKSFK